MMLFQSVSQTMQVPLEDDTSKAFSQASIISLNKIFWSFLKSVDLFYFICFAMYMKTIIT